MWVALHGPTAMEVETTYKFDGDDKVSDVTEFLLDRFNGGNGWAADHDDGKPSAEPTRVGGYSHTGDLRLEVTQQFDTDDEE